MTIKSLVNRSNILLRAIIKKALFSLSRHENTAHSGTTVQTEQDQQDGAGKEGAKEDFLFNYHQAKLTFGLILFEFDDAIKEGTVIGSMIFTGLACFCSKHMARPNMLT